MVLVTGGGGGIGAAVAVELGRLGDHVVTVDPLVSVDGTEVLPPPEETTAGRIVAAGGSAEASAASVADREAIAALVERLVAVHGGVDAVVNIAGISRPTGFAKGEESDWAEVLAVHLDGYVNVLDAVLPHMAAAGRGHVVGVTSGSGWRAADAGAYSGAKRAVAALTWQLGRVVPSGVAVNAMSPIAMTRMVTAALGRAGARAPSRPASTAATGGLSLGSMPAPEDLGPLGASLAGHGPPSLRGQVLFAGGSEVAVVDPPRLLEVVRTGDAASAAAAVAAFTDTLVEAERAQATAGGANPRFGRGFGERPPSAPVGPRRAVVVSDRPHHAATIAGHFDAEGVTATVVRADQVGAGFDGARAALAAAEATLGGLDVVVVALGSGEPADEAGAPTDGRSHGWGEVLASHRGLAARICRDAAWGRAAADHATATGRPLRLVQVIDATSAGGRSRAQAAAQLARASRRATGDGVAAFAVALEAPHGFFLVAALVAELAWSSAALDLAGAELVVGAGWLGLRSHPRPAGSIVFGGPELPPWFDAVLEEQCR